MGYPGACGSGPLKVLAMYLPIPWLTTPSFSFFVSSLAEVFIVVGFTALFWVCWAETKYDWHVVAVSAGCCVLV
jgi:hypothetical protein